MCGAGRRRSGTVAGRSARRPRLPGRPGAVLDCRADRTPSRESRGCRLPDGELIGIAMSGPPLDAGAAWARQLCGLYVLAADHGTGAGARRWRRLSIRRSRWRCGWPTRTLVHKRSTATTASLPTGRPRSRAGCGRSAWSDKEIQRFVDQRPIDARGHASSTSTSFPRRMRRSSRRRWVRGRR